MNHGKITWSFQDHQFFVVETPIWKEIIIGHPVSVRLGLIQVLCKNYAKNVSSIKTTPVNNLTRINHIDGKTWPAKRSSSEPRRGRKSKKESFQDILSRPQSITGQNKHEKTKPCSFQDPKFWSNHTYSRNDQKRSKSSSFQDHHPWQQSQKWQNEFPSTPQTASTERNRK